MSNASGGPIRLFVLGDARIETPTGEIEPSAEMVFAAALYLLLERRQPVTRKHLAGVLWPTVPVASASHNLRQTLLKLRKLGFPVQAKGTSQICWIPSEVTIDYEEFGKLCGASETVTLERLSLLPSYAPTFSSQYLDWLDEWRLQIEASITRGALEVISRSRSQGRWAEVETSARHLLRLMPYNEEATLALAEALAMRGSKLDSLRVLDDYLTEVGSGPSDLRIPVSVMRKRISTQMPTAQSTNAGDSVFLGRSDLMMKLSEMLRTIDQGRGGSILVWGDAGIGKSRLLAEIAAFATLQGIGVVRTQCRLSERNRPLSLFMDIVPQLRRLRGAIGCSPETMKYLDRITQHSKNTPTESPPAGDAAFVYAKVQQALFDLIDAISEEKPLVVVIDDVHQLDAISGSLLADLIPWCAERPVLFAFTGRERSYEWMDRLATELLVVQLPPLDIESSRALVRATVSSCGRQINESDIAWCSKVAEGNPYFLVELATHWTDIGNKHIAPPSLAAAIDQRVAKLEPASRQLLQTCALLGKNSTLERVEKVLGYQHFELFQCIEELGVLGMLVIDPRDGHEDAHARMVPRHELLATAAEAALSGPALAYLHRRIGTVLESEIHQNQSASILWDCAKHWQLSGNGPQAFFLARTCATHLMDLGLCSVAADAYERALPYCATPTQRLEMLEGQAAAYFRASDWDGVAATAGKVRALQRHVHPDHDGHDDIELMDLRALWLRGDLEAAANKALSCLACGSAHQNHRLRAGTMALMLLDLACDHAAIRRTYESMREFLGNPETDLALRLEATMVFETVCGDLAIGVEAAQSFVQVRRKQDSIADLMRALTNGAVAARTAGSLDLTKLWLNEAMEIADSHKLPLASEVPMQLMASVALDENHAGEAQEWYQRLLALPTRTFDSITIRNAIGLRIALCEGKVTEARRLVDADIKRLGKDPNPHRRTYGLALLMAVELAEGGKPSKQLLADLEQGHLAARRNARQAFATFVLVCGLRRVGQARKASDLLEKYVKLHRREHSQPPYHILRMLEGFPGCSS